MTLDKILVFKVVTELEQFLDDRISTLKAQSDELSKVIGEKLRTIDSTNNDELLEFKSKLEGSATDPKKKTAKKKDQKNNWYQLGAVSVYDGIGLKGELELYFKALDEIKSELEVANKVKLAIVDLVSKGLKKDLGCVFVMSQSLPAEIAFTSSAEPRKKFVYKAVFDVPIEN
ncbi:MAG TPA: hypothetical protein VIG05_00060 [Candidatus Nitrosotenuis sp.]|jgi:hypothetical protein